MTLCFCDDKYAIMFSDDENDSIEITGSLMLAHPHLKDPNFVRSVVLMTAHEDEGSLGVVINRSAGMALGEVDPSLKKYGLQDVPLYIGGPVASDQLILAGWKVDSIFNEFQLFFGLDPAKAQIKREQDPDLKLRAFRGYAGWSKDQLEGELSDNAWVVSEMDGIALNRFEGDDLWRHVIMNINLELGLMSMAPDIPESN